MCSVPRAGVACKSKRDLAPDFREPTASGRGGRGDEDGGSPYGVAVLWPRAAEKLPGGRRD